MTFLSLIIFLLSSSLASAISATSLSPCYNTCNGERTHPGDVVCGDNDYNDSSQGQKFKACLSCESTSTAYNNVTDNDIYWFLCTPSLPLPLACADVEIPKKSI